jgi:hypothetical protein
MTAKAAIRAAPRCPQPMMTPPPSGRADTRQRVGSTKRAHAKALLKGIHVSFGYAMAAHLPCRFVWAFFGNMAVVILLHLIPLWSPKCIRVAASHSDAQTSECGLMLERDDDRTF